MWDNLANGSKIREFETKGSFGMCIDLVSGPSFYREEAIDGSIVDRWTFDSIWTREWRYLHFQQ